MYRFRNTLREHRHFFIVVTLLTLATTFPTIVYVFKTDVFWHPAGTSHDVYNKFWDVWYGRQFLAGQADPLHTNLIFYPEGTPLTFHPFSWPHILAVNALSVVMPVSNAFSLSYLLIIALCAVAAYAYLTWLFSDKWIALFGGVVFGFSPHIVGHPNHVEIAFIASIPMAVYCFHRGTNENRPILVFAGGLLTGLTTLVSVYTFVCLMITLGLFVLALAASRWRDKRFWLNIGLFALAVSISSLLRVYPMLTYSDSFAQVAMWHGQDEVKTDAISFLVNHKSPLFSRTVESNPQVFASGRMSETSYLGYLPLLLIAFGLFATKTRRKMAPWLFLCVSFLIFRLGSQLVVHGTVYPDIRLPKHYLNLILPVVFASFWEADHFMMGALIPFAALVCFGLVALRGRFRLARKPAFTLALVAIVALEYHIPVRTDRIFPLGDGDISRERFAFLDWLGQQDGDIRLINLPMGRQNSKLYNLYQSLSGFPHAEGAISRTPDSAFDYIRANRLLNAWRQQQPVACLSIDRETYIGSLTQLEDDGFSHVVHHRGFYDWQYVADSFKSVDPAYADEFVLIYRLPDLRASCPAADA